MVSSYLYKIKVINDRKIMDKLTILMNLVDAKLSPCVQPFK